MSAGRRALVALVTMIVVLGFGYAWGASGRRLVQDALQQSQLQLDSVEARGAILEARVSLYNNNFGDASRRLEDAKGPLRRVKDRMQDAGDSRSAASIDAALRLVNEAQIMAGKLDPSANARAGDALEAIRVGLQR